MTEYAQEQDSATEQESVGMKLARARESQDMSVADVARALRLSEKQVEALESGDYGKLPGRTFVRGFARNYARLVHLDADEILKACLPAQTETESNHIQAPSEQIIFSEHQRKPWLKWLAVGFVVVAVTSWGVLEWLGPVPAKQGVTIKPPVAVAPLSPAPVQPPISQPSLSEPQAKTVPVPPTVEPVASPVGAGVPHTQAPVPATTAALARATLAFSGRAWVEVRDRNGKIILSQNNQAGMEQTIEGEPPLSLVIGSAPNVKLTYKGRLIDLSQYAKADVARLTLE